ncbi:MAG: phosphate ABC transporter permease subunit PstC [Candidatus Cloacimonadota bacterium]|nr:MAG: phosphate ABC transporter permease subunit PstC [Candidatus Cloacimonadota bacterium]PIE77705.1 MAG: phosphate ABC transporter permease subunit PstC [Candidatus Delongbacteria bacterium]
MNNEKVFKIFLLTSGIAVFLLTIGILFTLFSNSIPAIKEYGLGFIFSGDWNPTEGRESYGAMPFIVGTLLTSFIALFITFPFAFSISIFLGEYYRSSKVSKALKGLVELLAGIPSVVYGFWGFYTIKPIISSLGLNSQGYGIFTASILLAVMIIPYASSISTEIISMVSKDLKEAAYSLGSTHFEVIRYIIIPKASSGIFASLILALGRALGETMAVTMVIGNQNSIPSSIFDMGNTMASLIANQFGEADGIKLYSLIYVGLLLFIITAIVNLIGRLVMEKFN